MSSTHLKQFVDKINEHYVMPDRIPAIKERLDDRWASGAYASLDGEGFAEAVTADLRDVSGDMHFKVSYRSEAQPLREASDQETPEEVAEFRRVAMVNNHGCEKVERLAGNVGLWRISEFYDLIDGSGPTFVSSMRLLENTGALIVNVRGNSGGDPATVALACSFFFDVEPVHLNTLESKQGTVKQQWWTQPHLECQRYLDRMLFVLTDPGTASAAEEFAYDLQSLKRARIVGSRTAGASHLRENYQVDEHFSINVPIARPVNPYTLDNWESVGVQPDVEVDPVRSFESAYYLALESLALDSSAPTSSAKTRTPCEGSDEVESALAALVARSRWLTDASAFTED